MTDKERYKKMRSEERFTLIMMTGELERAEPGMTVEDFLKTSINYKDFKKKNEQEQIKHVNSEFKKRNENTQGGRRRPEWSWEQGRGPVKRAQTPCSSANAGLGEL